jgi:hypothetical protein
LRKLGRHHELSEDGNNWKRASEVENLFSTTLGKKRIDHTASQPTAGTSATTTGTDELEVELTPIAEPDSPAVWYFIVDNTQSGPVNIGQLVTAVQEGRIPLDALVWRDGFPEWQAVRDTHDVMALLDDSWRYTRVSVAATQAVALSRRSSYAGYSLWLGIVCFLFSWIPLVGLIGVVPLILGGLTIRDVRRNDPPLGGMGAGITGIVFGLISIAIAVIEVTIIAFFVWNKGQT